MKKLHSNYKSISMEQVRRIEKILVSKGFIQYEAFQDLCLVYRSKKFSVIFSQESIMVYKDMRPKEFYQEVVHFIDNNHLKGSELIQLIQAQMAATGTDPDVTLYNTRSERVVGCDWACADTQSICLYTSLKDENNG